MPKIAIVTDSAACLPPDLVRHYCIQVIPFRVVFGRQVFRDGVDLTAQAFYALLSQAESLPTTSQPSIAEFLETYRRISQEAEAIVSIHVPAAMTGTYSTARTAWDLVGADKPIAIIDCGSAAMGEGFVVLAAARAAAAGQSLEQVVAAARAVMAKTYLFAALDTLDYLRRGGRVAGVVALVGNALHIKPVFCLKDGHVGLLTQRRSRRQTIEYMVEAMAERVGEGPVHAAVFHGAIPEEAAELQRAILSRFNCAELYTTQFTPVMGAHTGPGVWGVTFYSESDPSPRNNNHLWSFLRGEGR